MADTGLIFGEHVRTEKIKRHKHSEDGRKPDQPMRQTFLLFFLFIATLVLTLKLSTLQIVKGNYYRKLADSNRIRTSVLHASRGVIADRNGIPLVFNAPGFRKIEKSKTIFLDQDTAMHMIANGARNIEVDSLRQYIYRDIFAHIIGYVGQISESQLKNPDFSTYGHTDVLGKTGIEYKYQDILRGEDGKELIEVDSSGRSLRTLGRTDPVPGKDITLSIDSLLQHTAYEAMKDVKKGALIVSKPNGEILSLVSIPSFDPNLFTLGSQYIASSSGYQNIESILTDDLNQPLLNRAIGGTYPPGSTFKIVTAATGLEDKIIDKNFKVNDTGVIKLGEFSFANWFYLENGKTDGEVDVVKAISRSNDIFFYKLAEKIGVQKLSSEAEKFGLGRVLGIDLDGEEKGIVPSAEWKKKVLGEDWYLGDTYHYGIGQGFLLTTPLQVNMWTQVIANKGVLYKPHVLLNSKSSPRGEAGEIQNSKFLSDSTVDLVRKGMVNSCEKGGVAWPFFDFKVKNENLKIDGKNFLPVSEATHSAGSVQAAQMKDFRHVVVACKTGTAQHGGEETKPHAWITLFAPAYNPEIVVTVLSEESGQGSNVAGPIAKKVVEAYFEGKKN